MSGCDAPFDYLRAFAFVHPGPPAGSRAARSRSGWTTGRMPGRRHPATRRYCRGPAAVRRLTDEDSRVSSAPSGMRRTSPPATGIRRRSVTCFSVRVIRIARPSGDHVGVPRAIARFKVRPDGLVEEDTRLAGLDVHHPESLPRGAAGLEHQRAPIGAELETAKRLDRAGSLVDNPFATGLQIVLDNRGIARLRSRCRA